MVSKIIASVVTVLALGAGVAYATTQLASSDGTQVCVNGTNGLMRAAAECREGEYAMTIGGGSEEAVTSDAVTVDVGTSGTPTALPLTGLTIKAVCDRQNAPSPPYSPDAAVARIVISAPTGTMDAVTSGSTPSGFGKLGTFGGTSLTASFMGVSNVGDVLYGDGSAIASANGATATITWGAQLSEPEKTCKFLWQATEAPN